MNHTLTRRKVLTLSLALSLGGLALTGCDTEDAPIRAIAFVIDPTTTNRATQHQAELATILKACTGLDKPIALFRVADEKDNAVLLLWEGKLTRQNLAQAEAKLPELFAPVPPNSGSDIASALRAGKRWLKDKAPELGGRKVLVTISDLIPDPRKDEHGTVLRAYDDPKTSTLANDLKNYELHVFGVKSADIAAAEEAHPSARIHQEGVQLTPESLLLPKTHE